MLIYVAELKQRYEEGTSSKVEYIRNLLSEFKRRARDKEGYQARGIKALFALTKEKKEKGLASLSTKNEIHLRAGFPSNYSHCGMWGSVQAGIVEEIKGPERYNIRPEFYQAIEQVLSDHL